MAVQLSVAARNARLDAIESAIGASAILKIRTGAPPASCAAADTGSVLATIALQSDWAAAAASGTKAFQGTMQDASADASGTAAHFRVYANDGTTCHMQGTVGTSGADLNLSSVSITAGDPVTITSFTLTDANA